MLLLAVITGCAAPQADLLTTNFVDPADVSRISRFRSCCGHDYSWGREENRSMKHYVHGLARFGVTNDQMPVYAPFDGTVTRVTPDNRELPCFNDTHGAQVFVRPDAQKGVYLKLFHVNPTVQKGDRVTAGEQIAWADLRECDYSDPSVVSEHPSSFDVALHRSNASYPVFEALTEGAWTPWIEATGLQSPAETVISEAERDADPCTDYWHECEDGMIGLWGNEAYPPYWR